MGFDELAAWASEWVTWDDHPRVRARHVRRQGPGQVDGAGDSGWRLLPLPPASRRLAPGPRLLVWHSGIDDPLTGGHYTLKVYTSEKAPTADGRGSTRRSC